MEVAEAKRLGIPVFTSNELLTEWKELGCHPPKTVTQEAHEIVNGQRNSDYGHPLDDFGRTGKIWAAILGLPEVTPQQVAMCMVGIKLSRQCNRAKRDNLVDGCGYLQTIEMIERELDRRQRVLSI